MDKWRRPEAYWEMWIDGKWIDHGLMGDDMETLCNQDLIKGQIVTIKTTLLEWNTYFRTEPIQKWMEARNRIVDLSWRWMNETRL